MFSSSAARLVRRPPSMPAGQLAPATAPMAITESWAQLAALGATADGIFVKPTFLLAANRSRAGCAGALEEVVARFEQFLDAAPSRGHALAVGVADVASRSGRS